MISLSSLTTNFCFYVQGIIKHKPQGETLWWHWWTHWIKILVSMMCPLFTSIVFAQYRQFEKSFKANLKWVLKHVKHTLETYFFCIVSYFDILMFDYWSWNTHTVQGPFFQPWPHRSSLSKIRESEKFKYPVRTNEQAIFLFPIWALYMQNATYIFYFLYILNENSWHFSSFSILAGCSFNGEIPDELGNLAELSFL